MFALKDAGFADIIGQYLVNLAKTDSALDAQVLKNIRCFRDVWIT